MAKTELTAEVRSEFKKSFTRTLRAQKIVPATVYGKHLEAPVSISLSLEALKDVLAEAGVHSVIDLNIDGSDLKKTVPVILKAVQREPRTRKILSVDFQAVSMTEKVSAQVPVHITGECIGVKMGGSLDLIHREVLVKALPADLPENVTLDVTNLKIGDSIKFGDIKLDKIELEGQADDIVVLVRGKTVAQAAGESEDASEAEAPAAPGADTASEESAE